MESWAWDPVYSVEREHCLIVTGGMVEISTKSCSMDRNVFDFVRDLMSISNQIKRFRPVLSHCTVGSKRPGSGCPLATSDSRNAKLRSS